MRKTKNDRLNDLVAVAYRMDEKANLMRETTKALQKMALLARKGLKESSEYKQLEMKYKHPVVTDFGDEMQDLQRVVKHLKRYKFQ